MSESDHDYLNSIAASRAVPPQPEKRKRALVPWFLTGTLLIFSAGLVLSPWFHSRLQNYLPESLQAADTISVQDIQQLRSRLAELEASQASLAQHMPALNGRAEDKPVEQRIDQLEADNDSYRSQEHALASQIDILAAKVEHIQKEGLVMDEQLRDLYVLTVVRRMMEAGRPLTQLEPLLLGRFGQKDAQALENLLTWSKHPQTRETLRSRLQSLLDGPQPTAVKAEPNWWERLKTNFEDLVFIRPAEQEENKGLEAAVKEARAAFDQRDLGLALHVMSPVSQTAEARQWLADVRILQNAEMALDALDGQILQEVTQTLIRKSASQVELSGNQSTASNVN